MLIILATPLLTRLFSPNDFGVLAVYAGLLGVFSAIASLRYELAIPMARNDAEADNIVAVCLMLVGSSALFLLFPSLLMNDFIARSLNSEPLADYLWLVPLGILFAGIYNIFQFWNIRNKNFNTIARTRLRQAFFILTVQFALFHTGFLALLLGQLIGQSAGLIKLGGGYFQKKRLRGVNYQRSLMVLRKYQNFPKYSVWTALVNKVSFFLPTFFIAIYFGPVAAGLYSVAHRVSLTPLTVVGAAIRQTFYSFAARAYQENRLGQLVLETYSKVIYLSIPPALLVFLFAPALFTIILGEQWREAGELVRWMALWLGFQFVSAPFFSVFNITGLQRNALLSQLIMLFFSILALSAGAYFGDLVTTVILISIFNAICYTCILIWVFLIAKTNIQAALTSTLQASMYGGALIAPLAIAEIKNFTWLAMLGSLMCSGLICAILIPKYRHALS